jgi:glycosyltransferase involved in cell wall biosynthesis
MVHDTSPVRLLVISHVTHYLHEGQLYAYGPYSREIDIWADLFREVVIAAPCRRSAPPPDALPFTRANIAIHPVRETGGETLGAKLFQVFCLPALVGSLVRAMLSADAVHVRCPGNLGLVGAAVAPLCGRPMVAKYAGQWNGYAGEPWTVRLQRRLLRSWWRGPVTVYGQWPDQPSHIVPFFTSMMTTTQVQEAGAAAGAKVLASPLRVLFSGRLAPEKRVGALLDAVALATAAGVRLEVVIVGDGGERASLEAQVAALGIGQVVRFVGALPFEQGLRWNEWAHCFVLPSRHSEGWPKVIAEAMCYGVLCLAVDHGQVSSMLQGRGVLMTSGSAEEIAAALAAIANDPRRYHGLMHDASLWARQYSLEGLRDALGVLLSRQWNVRVGAIRPAAAGHAQGAGGGSFPVGTRASLD